MEKNLDQIPRGNTDRGVNRVIIEFLQESGKPWDGQATWKVIPIYNMVRLLQDAGFKIKEIRYASVRAKDYLMLPLALLVYPVQFLYMQFAKNRMPVALRHAMYPFSSLLYRHYLVVCEKRAESAPSSV